MYQEARDAAWRTLLRLEKKELPVDIRGLLSMLRIPVLPFPDAKKEPRLYALLQKTQAPFCVSLKIQGIWQIFLKERAWDERKERFALAHELGHMILHHPTYPLEKGAEAFRGWENQGDLMDDPEEIWDYAADIFAIRLLSPACVLHALYLDQPSAIASLCGLPPKAAALRAERMELLNQRDAFFTHPLERQVHQAFLPFIEEKRHLNMKKEQMIRTEMHPAQALLYEVLPDPPARPSGEKGHKVLFFWAAALLGLLFIYLIWFRN